MLKSEDTHLNGGKSENDNDNDDGLNKIKNNIITLYFLPQLWRQITFYLKKSIFL